MDVSANSSIFTQKQRPLKTKWSLNVSELQDTIEILVEECKGWKEKYEKTTMELEKVKEAKIELTNLFQKADEKARKLASELEDVHLTTLYNHHSDLTIDCRSLHDELEDADMRSRDFDDMPESSYQKLLLPFLKFLVIIMVAVYFGYNWIIHPLDFNNATANRNVVYARPLYI